jgi:hypothetical protein
LAVGLTILFQQFINGFPDEVSVNHLRHLQGLFFILVCEPLFAEQSGNMGNPPRGEQEKKASPRAVKTISWLSFLL